MENYIALSNGVLVRIRYWLTDNCAGQMKAIYCATMRSLYQV
jgi:hypothetical protein